MGRRDPVPTSDLAMVALNRTAFTALAATAQMFNIVDFQGHLLNLAFGTITDGNPIINQIVDTDGSPNQNVSD